QSSDEGSGNMEDYSTPENTIDSSNDDDNITLTFDEGCVQSEDYYIDREEYPDTPKKEMLFHMQEEKCFSENIVDDIYATGMDITPLEGNNIEKTTPVYIYGYVYGEALDYAQDIYIVLEDGTKVYPNDMSEINESEGYLIYEVDSGYGDIKDIVINYNDTEYSIKDIEFYSNGGTK
ncbi:MAG: hypothetical protein ACK5HR_00500, partial [Mycoplasmatales bacterium]